MVKASKTPALSGAELEAELADPGLTRARRFLVNRLASRRPDLRDEGESAANYALAVAIRNWKPSGGATFRSYAIQGMKLAISSTLRNSRPRGYREGQDDDRPRFVSLDQDPHNGPSLAEELVADEEPVGADLEQAETLEEILREAGRDEDVVRRVFLQPGGTQRNVAREMGVTCQRVNQRLGRGLKRMRESLQLRGVVSL